MTDKPILLPDSEDSLYARVRDLVVSARQTVARGVDLVQVQVHTNFEIGRHIVEFEQQGADRAAYGEALLKRLAEQLVLEFGKGLSKSNLEYMRRFYLVFHDRLSIAQTASGQSNSVFNLPSSAGACAMTPELIAACARSAWAGGRFGLNRERQRLTVHTLGAWV